VFQNSVWGAFSFVWGLIPPKSPCGDGVALASVTIALVDRSGLNGRGARGNFY